MKNPPPNAPTRRAPALNREELQTTLGEIRRVQEQKRAALGRLDAEALLEIAGDEKILVERLKEHLGAREGRHEPSSIDLRGQIQAVRRDLATNWILAHKLNEFVSQTLSCLASAARPDSSEPYQGLVIDQTV